MNLEQFIAKWSGKPVDFDGVYPNQCMDLMHQYVNDVLGITDRRALSAPGAKDVYLNYPNGVADDEYFDRIPVSPDQNPQPGDIIFWGTEVGKYGHVAICVSGDKRNFMSFDANFPLGSLPHIQKHTYKGVLGWLRPSGKEDTMSLKLFRKDGDGTVYAQIWPVLGGDSLLIPIPSEQDAKNAFGPNWGSKVENVPSFTGIGADVRDVFGKLEEKNKELERQIEVLNTKINYLMESKDQQASSFISKQEELKSALEHSKVSAYNLGVKDGKEASRLLYEKKDGGNSDTPLARLLQSIANIFNRK